MLTEILEPVIEMLAGGGAQTGVILTLGIGALYFRKALGMGALAANWMRMVAFAMGIVALGLVSGVIPRINVDALFGLIGTIVDLVRWLLEFVLNSG